MRVLHLTNSLCRDGTGHTNSTVDLAIAQARLGHQVGMLCEISDAPTRALLFEHGVEVLPAIRVRTIAQLVNASKAMASDLASWDVLHLHTVRTTLLVALGSPARLVRHSVATIHNPHQRSVAVMYLAGRVVSMSNANRRHIRRRTLYIRRPVTVQNGTLGTFRLPPIADVVPQDLPPNSVVFVGALHARKGLDVLLDAIKCVREVVPDVRLSVVGNRDNLEMEERAVRLGLEDRVDFVGYVDDPRSYMKGGAVFVLPSRAEGFGNVLTEARECGVPIIASRVGGIPEALGAAPAGLLVEPGRVGELADAIAAVLTDAHLARALARSTGVGLDDMSTDRAARDYEAVYRSLSV